VTFNFPVGPRYVEVDQQGVVFYGHYLTWFDEAFTGFLAHVGVPYPDLIASGVDVQVVHAELDYAESVRWGDEVRVRVTSERVGATSMTTAFAVHRARDAPEPAVSGRLVHVCVAPADDWRKCPVPDALRAALGA
jgi:acyl-CoA thioester hydrolase